MQLAQLLNMGPGLVGITLIQEGLSRAQMKLAVVFLGLRTGGVDVEHEVQRFLRQGVLLMSVSEETRSGKQSA